MKIKSAIPIRNTTNSEQYVFVDEKRYLIPANQEKVFSPEIASAFTQTHPGKVVKTESIGAVATDNALTERIYLYNATGNPFDPDKIKIKRAGNGGIEVTEVDNPKKEPMVIRHKMNRGQKIVISGGEETALNMGFREIVFFPYSKMAFDKEAADWLMNRDQMQTTEMRGCVKYSRPPQGFEPDDTWSLLELQEYAKILDSKFDIGISQEALMSIKNQDDREDKLDEEKEKMLMKLFFFVADPNYRLPTRDEFASVMKKHEKAEKTKAA